MANLLDIDLGSGSGKDLDAKLEALLASSFSNKPQKVQLNITLKDEVTKELQKRLNGLNADELKSELRSIFDESLAFVKEFSKKLSEGYRPNQSDLLKLYRSAGQVRDKLKDPSAVDRITAKAYNRRNASLGNFESQDKYNEVLEENIRLMSEARTKQSEMMKAQLEYASAQTQANQEFSKSMQSVVDSVKEGTEAFEKLGEGGKRAALAFAEWYDATKSGNTESTTKAIRNLVDVMADASGSVDLLSELGSTLQGIKPTETYTQSIKESSDEVENLLKRIKELEDETESLRFDRDSADRTSYAEFEQRIDAEVRLEEAEKERRAALDELAVAQARLEGYMDDYFAQNEKVAQQADEIIEKDKEIARAQELIAQAKSATGTGGGPGGDTGPEGPWLNVLQQIRDTLISISKAIGDVSDEEGGVNNLIKQFERLDVVLAEIQEKVGTGVINVALGGASASEKQVDESISQKWSARAQSLRGRYDTIMSRLESKDLDLISKIWERFYADTATLDEIRRKYSRVEMDNPQNAQEETRAYTRFFQDLHSFVDVLKQEISQSNSQINALKAKMKELPKNSDDRASYSRSIENIQRRVDDANEWLKAIGKIGVSGDFAGFEKKVNAQRNDAQRQQDAEIQEKLREEVEKANEEVKAEVSNLDAVTDALLEIKGVLDDILAKNYADEINESIHKVYESILAMTAALKEVAPEVKVISQLQQTTPKADTSFVNELKARKQAIQDYKLSLQEEKIALNQAKRAQEEYIEAGKSKHNARQNVKDSDTAAEKNVYNIISAQNRAYKKMWEYRVEIAKLETDLKNDHTNEIALLKTQAEEQRQILQEKERELIASGKILNIQDRIARLADAKGNAGSLIQSYQAKAKDNMLAISDSQIASIEKLSKRGNWTSEYSQRLKEALASLNAFRDGLDSMNFDNAKIAFKDLQNTIDETIGDKALRSNKAPLETQLSNLERKITQIVAKNTAMGNEFQKRWENLRLKLDNAQSMEALQEVASEVNKLQAEMNDAGRTGQRFVDMFAQRLKSLNATFLSRYLSFYDIIRYSRAAFESIRELDTSLVDLRKTAKMSSAELEGFYMSSNDVAKQMGVTTNEIIEQASSWSRLGYNTAEASSKMAELSSQFASISPGMNTEEAQTGLVSIMKAWDVSTDQVKRDIMDNINTLGNNFALTNKDIIEGMERAGATLSAIGMDTKDSFALFTGAQEVIQNAEVVGTAIKTLSLRIRGYDEETEQLSDDVIEATGKVADLTKVASNNFAGVSLWADAAQTQYRSLVDYLGDIAEIWDEIDAKSQTQLLEKLFGKRGASVGSAILQNFDQVEAALRAMEDAGGSADREMSIIRDSIDFKLNELKETWVGTLQEILHRDDIGNIIDGLVKLSEALGWLIEKLGIIGSLATVGGSYAFFKNLGKPKRMVSKLGRDLRNLPLIDGFRLRYA